MKRREPSFLLLSLAVILPLLVLAVLAWIGTRAQIRGAWAAARDEARLAADSDVFWIAQELESRGRTLRLFPDPPPPGPPAIKDDPLDQKDSTKLITLRDDEKAGLSPAGLPRRVIAAIRVLESSRGKSDAEAAMRIAIEEAPSILTPRVFDQVNEIFPGMADAEKREWQHADELRALLGEYPEIEDGGEWKDSWWLMKSDQGIRYLRPDDLMAVINTRSAKANPKWAVFRISRGGKVLTGPEYGGATYHRPPGSLGLPGFEMETMADVTIPFGKDLRFQFIAVKSSAYENAARYQARWTFCLLAIAVIGAAGGLWVMHRVYERERKLNALKSDFVASVSHELRAPIASIRLMADALEAGKIEDKTAGEFHRLISREGARLSTLIENVLDFARIEQGRKQWQLEETDLRELLVNTVSLMEPLAAEKGIELVAGEFPEASVRIDPDAIRQALVNLLDNAIKFSPSGSIVEIRLLESEGWKIEISDHGPGIPKEEHARIFEKFHRLGSELRRESQGTGIGLSLVKAVAEAHGGRIDLESEPGKGSRFILTIPMSL